MKDTEEIKERCANCKWKGLRADCVFEQSFREYEDGHYENFLTYSCPKCGELLYEEEVSTDGIGYEYGDYDASHVNWGPGDYGDYGGE